jgi:hypothetical protein
MSVEEPAAGQSTQGRGRPTKYTPELAAQLCDYLSEGESLRTACAHEGMPDKAQVFRWLSASNTADWAQDFRDQYTRAKEEAADALAEDILDIADEPLVSLNDNKMVNAAIQRNKLRVDTRKFLMAKMKPKRYGDKLDLTSDGEKIERGMSIEEINAVLARAEAEKAEVTS